jgi:hypothetical protein
VTSKPLHAWSATLSLVPLATAFAGSTAFFSGAAFIKASPPMPAIACSTTLRCSGGIFASWACICLRALSIALPMRFMSSRFISV